MGEQEVDSAADVGAVIAFGGGTAGVDKSEDGGGGVGDVVAVGFEATILVGVGGGGTVLALSAVGALVGDEPFDAV